mgnify:CR=1 FL=1
MIKLQALQGEGVAIGHPFDNDICLVCLLHLLSPGQSMSRTVQKSEQLRYGV